MNLTLAWGFVLKANRKPPFWDRLTYISQLVGVYFDVPPVAPYHKDCLDICIYLASIFN
jgi:hypothetical protein